MILKQVYTLYAYQDMDGGIAAAICLRYLNSVKKTYHNDNIVFEIEPVPRHHSHTECFAGLLRKEYKKFNIPKKIIQPYDDFIDLSEIIFCKKNNKHNNKEHMYSIAHKLHTLFQTSHPLINKTELYKTLVYQISKNPIVEDLFDSNLLYESIVKLI